MREFSNLSTVVYKRTYARADNGILENFPDTVERVIGGNVNNHRVSEQEIQRLRYFLSERKAGPAGRGWWCSGAPAQTRFGGAGLVNCFSGDTKFLVRKGEGVGIETFLNVVGKTVDVLARDGMWRPAQVRSFGRQKLQEVSFKPKRRRTSYTMTFTCTPDHAWYTQRGRVTNLMIGDEVVMTPRVPQRGKKYEAGFLHGFVFGDGSQDREGVYRVRLCGPKATFLERLQLASGGRHTTPPSCHGDPVLYLKSPLNLKEVPADKEHLDYQAGFLAGWMATDGSTRMRLTSTDKAALDWVCDRAPLLGVCVTGRNTDSRSETNFGKRSELVEHLTLCDTAVPYRVTDIEDFGLEEEVFCVTEPETKSFTLQGGLGTSNCWFFTADDWMNYVVAQDLLMLGGGVGVSVERQFVDKLPKVKRNVVVVHKPTKDADFIVPDSREGWCELTRRVLEAFFVTGKGFSYSTVCIRPHGDPIKGFGGVASGPRPLVRLVEKLCGVMLSREGYKLRPIDAADIICSIGEMVVAGNVRRSAIIILGDPWDRDYLKAKRWDLGPVPTQRAMANFSVVADDAENDLRPLFWATYAAGEPFGIVNRHNIQTYGRMGEKKKDTATGVNPCAEACLEDGEPCNLQEINLAAIESLDEFVEASRLMHRWGKRVAMETYHWEKCEEVVRRNMRIGTGITGCLENPTLFSPEALERAYRAIQEENISYAKELGVNPSIRTTVIKPSGTMSKFMGAFSEGCHPAYSRHFIQRVRVASNDALIPKLQTAGHYMEPVERFDGSLDPDTMVVDFYIKTPESCPVADEGFDTWKQLDTVLMAQKYWADQAVSVTVYYKEEDVGRIQDWVSSNLDNLKTISFLRHSGHGFKQAPKEPITAEEYDRLAVRIKPVEGVEALGDGAMIQGLECDGGSCPLR